MSEPDERHRGRAATSPYPLSRLAPAFRGDDLADRLARSRELVGAVTTRRLEIIAAQMQALRAQAEAVLRDAERDVQLNEVRCNFKRRPGEIYHLYRRENDDLYFSMLSPREWGPAAPHAFVGSYRLEIDLSWTPVEEIDALDARRAELKPLLPE